MGNCWPKPVESIATGSIKPPSPVHKNEVVTVKKGGASPLPAPPPPARKTASVGAVPANGMIVTPNLKRFTLGELKRATQNFRPDTVLGEGGFGRVFKGYIDENTYAPSRVGVGMPVAVKKSNPDSEQGLKEWQAEVIFLGKFSHPNLVKLLGYCWEERQFLLVYEYMQRGSLESHLFRKGGEAMAWDIRMKIAVGAARGLAFLHNTEKQVIYRDFKASNILLDGEFNPKLSDFGLAKLGPEDGNSHVTTNPVGTYGYAAPEYIATGHLYVRSDVYGFGVVLLEIITGLRVLDLNRPGGQTNLVEWAMPSLNDKKKFRRLIDPRLMGQYPLKAAYEIGELILKCLKDDPKCRPDMQEVLDSLEQINKNHPKTTECKVMMQHETPCQQRHNERRALHHSHNGRDGGRAKGVGHRQHHKNSKAPQSY